MAPFFPHLLKLLCLSQLAAANVEKAIFLGPEGVPVPLAHPTLEDLHIDTLTPQENWSLRTRISAKFPSESSPHGDTTWLLLDNLQAGQRYEVRICWAATQPTSFTLRTHELSTVFDTPDLIASLWAYSTARQPADATPKAQTSGERRSSVLFLEIIAAADFFTTNATLMQNPPLVDADITLDPFLFNVLPRSLVPTIGYIIVVAAGSFMVARWVVAQIHTIISNDPQKQKKQQ
ncbi:hypothetical protein B0T14DRAFT_534436 [Immersiella caudata]|uniref:Uncharacterized protein n=1 Tax=Immersiella caudata TaxID=314043 RepID=A0AA40C696_9PEZI|nr:hypothetical protein B0T14DRAFT_534436 [Immersiella caudata]